MVDISQVVDVNELNYTYFTDWNLEQYKINGEEDISNVLSNFEVEIN